LAADKQRVQAERAEQLRQQRREAEIARGERDPDPVSDEPDFADIEY
jgi:sRNA-binding protein